jgi:endoglucanase
MAIPELLQGLLTAPGPSGYETAPAEVWRSSAREFAEVSADVVGSSVARVKGTGDGPLLAVVGHIDDEGYLWVGSVGGWDPQVLVGQRIQIVTRDGPVAGVIGRKAIHLLEKDERDKVAELKSLHVDIGAKDGDEVRARVRLGDVAVIAAEPVELPNNRVVSRSMDNRLGAFVAHEVARLVAEAGGAPGDVAGVAVAQEETSFAGAFTSTFGLRPDVAVVVDVTHASDVPGGDPKRTGAHALGSGPVIMRGGPLHPQVFELLHDAAEAEGIPFTIEAEGGATHTDADAVTLTRSGVPTGIVSFPLRYMHSPVEMVQLDDVEAAAKLIAAFALRLEPGISFER